MLSRKTQGTEGDLDGLQSTMSGATRNRDSIRWFCGLDRPTATGRESSVLIKPTGSHRSVTYGWGTVRDSERIGHLENHRGDVSTKPTYKKGFYETLF